LISPTNLSQKTESALRAVAGQGEVAKIILKTGRFLTSPSAIRSDPLKHELEAVTVTRHGKPVMAILPWELYESIMETLEIMGDTELMVAFRQGVKDMEEGRITPLDDVLSEDLENPPICV
jgi:PHD/YefM family antitoxin component YafN of YafNO toxin-antitoxin module